VDQLHTPLVQIVDVQSAPAPHAAPDAHPGPPEAGLHGGGRQTLPVQTRDPQSAADSHPLPRGQIGLHARGPHLLLLVQTPEEQSAPAPQLLPLGHAGVSRAQAGAAHLRLALQMPDPQSDPAAQVLPSGQLGRHA